MKYYPDPFHMAISPAGVEAIKEREGCRLTVYPDIGGLGTVGYGHRTKMRVGYEIRQATADMYLQLDLLQAEMPIRKTTHVSLTQNMFDALTSLIFNIGTAAYLESSLRIVLNKRDYREAADQFLRWNHVNRRVVDGLTKRREAERMQFLRGAGL